MTNVQNALSLINAAGKKKIDTAAAKEQKKNNHIANLQKKIKASGKQITNLLNLGAAIINNNLVSEYNQYTKEKSKKFFADGFYHRLGFYVDQNTNKLFLAIMEGGCCGKYDVLINIVNKKVVITIKDESNYKKEYKTIDDAWPFEQIVNNMPELEQRLIGFANHLSKAK